MFLFIEPGLPNSSFHFLHPIPDYKSLIHIIHFISFHLFLGSIFLFNSISFIYVCCCCLSFHCKIQRIVCNDYGLCPLFLPRSFIASGLGLNMFIQFELTLKIRTQVHFSTCGNQVSLMLLIEDIFFSPKLTGWVYLDLFLSSLFCYASLFVCFHASILLFWLLSLCNISLMWFLISCLTFPEWFWSMHVLCFVLILECFKNCSVTNMIWIIKVVVSLYLKMSQ